MSIVLDPEVKSLKLMSKQQIDEFMLWFLTTCSIELGRPCGIQRVPGQTVGTITVDDVKEAELFLNKLGMKSFHYMNKFITEKLNSDPKDYKRDMILWEAETKDNRILIKF